MRTSVKISAIFGIAIVLLFAVKFVAGRSAFSALWVTDPNGVNMYNTNPGGVGIGTAPLDKFHVAGNIIIDNGVLSPLGGQDLRLMLKPPGSIILMDNSVNSLLQVNADGKVGIGTTTPVEKLTVNGNIQVIADPQLGHGWFEIVSSSGPQMGGKIFYDGIRLGIKTPSYSNIPLSFAPNGVEAMIINPGGNVGIGVSNPSQKLEVDGTILGGLPRADVAIAMRDDNVRLSLMVAAAPTLNQVFVRYRETIGGSFGDPSGWGAWVSFGTPSSNAKIMDLDTSIAVDSSNRRIGLITARMSDGNVYSRYVETQANALDNPSLWTPWADFGNPGM